MRCILSMLIIIVLALLLISKAVGLIEDKIDFNNQAQDFSIEYVEGSSYSFIRDIIEPLLGQEQTS